MCALIPRDADERIGERSEGRPLRGGARAESERSRMAENTPNPGSEQPENRPPEGQSPGEIDPQAGSPQQDPSKTPGEPGAEQPAPQEPVSAEQASIDEMLRAAREAVEEVNAASASAEPAGSAPQPPKPKEPRAEKPKGQEFSQSAVDDALRAAREAIAAVNSGAAPPKPAPQPSMDEAMAEAAAQPQTVPANTHPFELQPLVDTGKNARPEGIDLLGDVNLDVKIELGRTRMFVEDVLRLKDGAVVELDKLAGDPVDVFVNERLIARGEVLVLNDNFCVRINEIVDHKAIEQARRHAS